MTQDRAAAPPQLLGTGFGPFHLVSGAALLVASVLAGALWSSFGPASTFRSGAAFAALAAVGLWAAVRHRTPAQRERADG